ncbi:fatty acid cis/trans isomerase [Marinobacter nanhaiticus D15-8W]|uniref:Peptidylprolyl isomerase n=1 Tax=Marinobacter nanhaiticus D15-8W TaxID=626887 RepID=N6W1G2_9GAMM|nr:fatty acid cis/trans isomerase [Marinobacter nanhaiticus]ENO16355.1 peptidylprolyl isomerase [Marinobacter nanhaiticus D15-8W]BES72784.1 fatty acid cis/trans isomerase [Marinobacter nanhaiticus D15-8W]
MPQVDRRRRSTQVAVLVLLSGLIYACSQIPTYDNPQPLVAINQTYSYQEDIRPIFESKCIACHGCYDAPCQLKLTSAEGVERGASPLPVYDGSRLEDMMPTRLGVDALNATDWRGKGFFSVLHGEAAGALDARDTAVLFKMIELGRGHPLPANSRVPEDVRLGIGRAQSCPTLSGFADYAEANPHGGMPFATTGLTDQEYQTLSTWIAEGAVTEPAPYAPRAAERAAVERWESFFNQSGLREQLVARYLFEHLFAAHLHFPDVDGSHFYELVRSWTPPGERILPVATVRPNDDPEGQFYYRLQPITRTIVEKTHITYALGDARMERYQSLFLESDWKVSERPGYGYDERSNPFEVFAAIPARARYQFMLDNAEYFVRNFIRGPVCRGQIATDVIRDQFWTVFEDPDQEAYVNDAAYRDEVTPLLGLPGQDSDILALGPEWFDYKGKRNDYLKLRQSHYAKRKTDGATVDEIWDGDGWNRDALLTIFRHHDSASVRRGLHGQVPRTIWVMDYPLLERTYYELVVNFNVFGSVSHQAQTRLYFDLIRNGAEHNFLRYVPADARQAIYDHWYQGSGKIKDAISYTDLDTDTSVAMDYESVDDRQDESVVMHRFATLLMERADKVVGPPDTLNRCGGATCDRPGLSDSQRQAEALLRPLTRETGATLPAITRLPEVTFLRVTDGDERWVYTLVHNRAHSNVAFMFGEDSRLLRDEDTVTVLNGTLGSYPNFSFDVPLAELDPFVSAFRAIDTQDDLHALAARWGIRRTHPEFWTLMADFQAYVRETEPTEAGVFDVNRYENL